VVERTKQAGTYRSEIAASVHEMMEGVFDVGLIGRRTMRAFDESCLSPALPMAPEEVRAIREQE
jgi:putative transcriptional regulator